MYVDYSEKKVSNFCCFPYAICAFLVGFDCVMGATQLHAYPGLHMPLQALFVRVMSWGQFKHIRVIHILLQQAHAFIVLMYMLLSLPSRHMPPL